MVRHLCAGNVPAWERAAGGMADSDGGWQDPDACVPVTHYSPPVFLVMETANISGSRPWWLPLQWDVAFIGLAVEKVESEGRLGTWRKESIPHDSGIQPAVMSGRKWNDTGLGSVPPQWKLQGCSY